MVKEMSARLEDNMLPVVLCLFGRFTHFSSKRFALALLIHDITWSPWVLDNWLVERSSLRTSLRALGNRDKHFSHFLHFIDEK